GERVAQWVRANLFVPDARVGWVPFAVWQGRRVIAEEGIDAVLTSGPPHSVHLTGGLLQRLTGRPWIADFRDPWTDLAYYAALPQSAPTRALERALERAVLRRADRVVTVSPAWRDLLRAKVERPDRAFRVIQNGFDPEDFGPPPEPSTDQFTVVHVGSLYGSRSPEALWEALSQLRHEGATPRLRLRLVGRVGAEVLAALTAQGLEPITEHVPYRPHREAVEEMQRATVLLLIMEPSRHERGLITGKLYEYLAAARPVLGIGDPEGDATAILEGTGAGVVFARDDRAAIIAYFRTRYAEWEQGRLPAGATTEAAAPYSRRVQAGQLADLAQELTT
ncbi:MAG: glycosyltransferase, partial [Rhodothermales bacterium]|nr:glycosyltransferase [Rhodothermales bacterium]